MNKIALALIGFYQKFISPYKGFKCAYGRHLNEKSCSAYGAEVFREQSFFKACRSLAKRLEACEEVCRSYGQCRDNRLGGLRRNQIGGCEEDIACYLLLCGLGESNSISELCGCGYCGTAIHNVFKGRNRCVELGRRKKLGKIIIIVKDRMSENIYKLIYDEGHAPGKYEDDPEKWEGDWIEISLKEAKEILAEKSE